jgi:hypothetical protein
VKNWGDNVFHGNPVGPDDASLFGQFLAAHDFSPNSRRAFAQDVRSSQGGLPKPTTSLCE